MLKKSLLLKKRSLIEEKTCYLVISENVINQLIFREKVLYLRPKSVCAVEVTMNVDWTCMNLNRKDVHA